MKIRFDSLPESGKAFHFSLQEAVGPSRITAHLNGHRIHISDCPDPPCHDVIDLPEGVHGAELLLTAEDSTGKRHQQVLHVIDDRDAAKTTAK